MKDLGRATSDDAVLAFLQAEIDTEHEARLLSFLSQVGYNRSVLIDNADLSDAQANRARATILGSHKGYGRNEALFQKFPNGTRWQRVLLDLNDIRRLKYVGTPEFTALSRGTRSVVEGAQNYKSNKQTADKVVLILDKISRGVSFPELVLVENEHKQLVIIEGNHRVTAYVNAGVAETRALVGTSPAMQHWVFI
jgi:ParB-like nuclease domain